MRDRFEEATVPLRKFMGRLSMDKEMLWPLYKKFDKCDADHSGEINIDEFFDHFHLEWSRFAERAFMVMEVGGDHKLSFAEFTVGLMNYCTSPHSGLVKFAFDLFDDDHSGQIDFQEVKQLLKMVSGKRRKESYYDDIMRKMDKDRDGVVTWEEFRDFEKKMASLLQPAFHLQQNLRKKILGEAYWDKFTLLRKQKAPGRTDLIAWHHELQTGEKLDRVAMKQQATKRQHGIVEWDKGKKGKTIHAYDGCSKDANKLKKIKFGDSIEIFEKQHEQKGGSWYKIEEKAEVWVEAKYVTMDRRWEKIENEKKRMKTKLAEDQERKEKAAADKKARQEAAAKEWMESTDKESGKKYWYNMTTSETTWNDPFK